jgi:adenosyl cobinamide kinase/adenosyl cobinamide phosphate guanylyltransferase
VRKRPPGAWSPARRFSLPGQPRRGRAFRVLVLGGARSGKSVTAERLLSRQERVDYVACGPLPSHDDLDWAERVRRHQERRPGHWTTMETLDLEAVLAGRTVRPLNLPGSGDGGPGLGGPSHGHTLGDSNLAGPAAGDSDLVTRSLADATPAGSETRLPGARPLASIPLAAPVLVDCLSTWLAGVMEECGLWAGATDADKQLAERVDGLVDAWRGTRRHVVAVSNEVGSGVIPGTVSGVRFRDELGVLNARIAAECEQVWLCVAGIAQRLR